MDEILPPGDGVNPFEYGDDFENGEGEYEDDQQQFQIVMQMGDQQNATNNQEWFASSRKPRKYRPPHVR